MTRIGLLSDTHSYFDPGLKQVLSACDEIWHAGDVGNISVYEELLSLDKPIRLVYGNIDGQDIRKLCDESLHWKVEGKSILMTHIGGYPGKYNARTKQALNTLHPDIFVCGHSHILRVIFDKENNLLYLNPGACGIEGFHQVRTVLRFAIDKNNVKDMEVIELGSRR